MATPAPTRGTGSSDDSSRRLWRLSGLGMELAAHVVAGLILGWLLDRWLETGPTFLVIGTIAGVAVGMVSFIRSAQKAMRRAADEYRRSHPPGERPPTGPDDA